MRQTTIEPPSKILKIFHVGFANLSQEKTFQTWDPLTIVRSHLGQEPVRFSTASGATVAYCRRSVGQVTASRCRTGCQLSRLEHHTSPQEVFHLILRTPGLSASPEVFLKDGHSPASFGVSINGRSAFHAGGVLGPGPAW